MRKTAIIILIFTLVYSFFVIQAHLAVDNYSDIIVATVFFFTLFSGFFITRQNDRYSEVAEQISTTDGYFSYLYRISGLIPRVQKEIREIIREHYQKIVESNNWAYHVVNPSTTLTRVAHALASITEKENENVAVAAAWPFTFEVIADLQLTRKKTMMLAHEKLLTFQWALIYILGLLLIVSFNFIPTHGTFINLLKIVFGISVLLVILLLKQLDDLSLFGKGFNKKTAEDIFRIIDERDAAEVHHSVL